MPSHFIWYELLTPDVEASQRFYTAVVGWAVNPSHHAASHYRHLTAPDGESVGGMLQLTEQMTAGGARPVWLGYIDVPDVDAAVTSIEAQGGRTQMPAMTIESVGRMAMVADPQGAPVSLTKGEYAMLLAFLEAPQRPLSREYLLQATRVHEDIFDRSVDVQVLRLRRKLERGPDAPRIIRTERGFGYVFDLPVERL